MRMLKSGIILNNDTYRLFFQLGWVYYHKARNYDDAINFFIRAKKFDEHIPYADRFIAYSYEKKGDNQKALEILQNLLDDKEYHLNDKALINIIKKGIKRIKRKIQNP